MRYENAGGLISSDTGSAREGAPKEGGLKRSEHLLELPGDDWALWRCVGLRGAGFPVSDVSRLASTECATAAREALRAEIAVSNLRDAALSVVNEALDRLRSSPRLQTDGAGGHLVDALRRLKSGKIPDADSPHEAVRSAALDLRSAVEHAHNMSHVYKQLFEAAEDRTSKAIKDLLRDDRYREAIIWQNRRAFHTGLKALADRPQHRPARSSKVRQHEELAANYLQRYCVKNDSIGFFGPVGWASLVKDGEAIRVSPGEAFLAKRTLYFEGWCIDALAKKIEADKAISPWLSPRILPFYNFDGGRIHAPLGLPEGVASKLSTKHEFALACCDGERTAREIAATLTRSSSTGITDENEAYVLLEELKDMGLISWSLDIPAGARPERTLEALLERIEDEKLREAALGPLRQLKERFNQVAHAAGHPESLDRAMAEMEAAFGELAGVAPTRSEGKAHAGRTLVYEDCRRDVEVSIGADLIAELWPPLSLLLASTRWFTYKVAEIYQNKFEELYNDLIQETGSSAIPALIFWHRAQPLLFGSAAGPADLVESALQERWAQVLAVPSGQSKVTYDSEALRPAVLAAFDAPGRGWAYARYHSPDVMIAAPSVEAILKGDFQFVLGELHISSNTLRSLCFVAQHPSPQDLFRFFELDIPDSRLVPITPKEWGGQSRTLQVLTSRKDFWLEIDDRSITPFKPRTLPISALIVEDSDDGLRVRTRDNQQSFQIIEAFAVALTNLSINRFKAVCPGAYSPRISIDRLVISRETWRPAASDLEFVNEKNRAARFLAAQRFAKSHNMPRLVFAKLPIEPKPFYVDFDSPIYIDIFARLVRRMLERGDGDAPITISEMVPSPDQTWLTDAGGRRYTSELRFVAVDMSY